MAIPLVRNGTVEAAAEVEVGWARLHRLQQQLRVIDGTFFLSSILLISLALTLLLERRVTHPVASLVGAMRYAEAGGLDARVADMGGGEFGSLGRSFNSMLGQIEDLTNGRVTVRTTRDLAEKNRQLQTPTTPVARPARRRPQRCFAALGQMAATIAHELGTPSTRPRPRSPAPGSAPTGRRREASIIESQVERMIETIRSVLDRTRNRQRRKAPVAIRPLIDEALTVRRTPGACGLTVGVTRCARPAARPRRRDGSARYR
jgi:signal transduction histidine kinase